MPKKTKKKLKIKFDFKKNKNMVIVVAVFLLATAILFSGEGGNGGYGLGKDNLTKLKERSDIEVRGVESTKSTSLADWFWSLFENPSKAEGVKSDSLASESVLRKASFDPNDQTPPEISIIQPKTATSELRPKITIRITDVGGSGVDESSITFIGNGHDLSTAAAYIHTVGFLSYTPTKNLAQGVNTLDVTASDNSGNEATAQFKFGRYNGTNAVTIDKDNVLYVDGREFFPIGIYAAGKNMTQAEVREMFRDLTTADSGFNSILHYGLKGINVWSKNFMDMADEFGLKVLVRIKKEYVRGGDNNGILNSVKRFVKHPALLSWYIDDEPVIANVPPSILENAYQTARTIDVWHPASMAILRTKSSENYSQATDIMMPDKYPFRRSASRSDPITLVSDGVEDAIAGVNGEKPVWAVIQAFGYQSPEMEGWWYGEPSLEEMRAMTYLAIAHGAKGILYYTYKSPGQYDITNSPNYPNHWTDLKAITNEMRDLTPVLLSEDLNGEMIIEITSPANATDNNGDPAIHYLVKENGNQKTLIAVNVLDRNVEVLFRTEPNLPSAELNVLFEDRKVALGSDSFNDTFRPYEVHIYQGNFEPQTINGPPVFDDWIFGSEILYEGALFEFNFNATDPDGDELTYLAYDLPSGAELNPGSGNFRWQPKLNQGPGAGSKGIKSYNIKIEVSDETVSVFKWKNLWVMDKGTYGDVNEDGFITEEDAELILAYVVGKEKFSPIQKLAADVSGNGRISQLDASYIKQYVQGLITSFPVVDN